MKRARRGFGGEFRAKVALAALKGQQTLSELASLYARVAYARETLPSKTPETLPRPREPTTIRSASTSSA